jgi:hypothetical protein
MSNIYNPAPRTTIVGIQDEYTTSIAPSVTPAAFSNMLAFTFAPKGPIEEGIWATGTKLVNIFGSEVVNLNNKYTTHQTLFTTYANKVSNPICMIRVAPSDIGPKPAIGVWAEFMHDDVQIFERDQVTGKFLLDGDGNKIPKGIVPGFKVRYFTKPIPKDEFGKSSSQLGSEIGTGGQSKIIPLFDIEHAWFGESGNDVGIRIFPCFSGGDDLAQVSRAEMLETGFPFRLQVVRRTTASIAGNIVKTAVGQDYVEGSFKPDTIHPLSKANYDIFKLLDREYTDLRDESNPAYSEIGKVHVYREELASLFEELNTYLEYDNPYCANPFTGVDFDGKPYDCYDKLDIVERIFKFSTNSTAWLEGGSDGTLSFEEFDKAVRRYLEQVTSWDEHIITNIARYPIKMVVDSGFTMQTKEKLIHFTIGIHKAAWLLLTSQDVSLPPNDEVKDAALLKTLSNLIASYPESSVTTACRASMVGRCGVLANTTYTGLVPVLYSMFTRIVDMFGSPTGNININSIMQVLPNKLINEFTSLSYDYQGYRARQRDWDNGAVVIEAYDQRQWQIPSYRSVYDKPTSILSDFGNVIIAVDCIHCCYRTWQDLVGVVGLTDEQLVERANEITRSYTNPQRYANLVVVTANNYKDAIDLQNKFSWHSNIILQGSVPARNAEISVTGRVRS